MFYAIRADIVQNPRIQRKNSVHRTNPVAVSPLVARAQQDDDMAVFRFTLGNEDLDNQVPRIVGGLAAVALTVNHLTSGYVSDAQQTSEYIGAFLAFVCLLMPGIEKRLRDAAPGRGRR